MLSVFHNRRWDTDITTLRGVLDSGSLGEIWRFDWRFRPRRGRDFGSRASRRVCATWAAISWTRRCGSWDRRDGCWPISELVGPSRRTHRRRIRRSPISHASGAHSHVSASKVNRTVSRELRVFGSLGSYVSSQSDVQAQAIFAGSRPVDDLSAWGYEVEERWGTLATAAGSRRVPSMQGSYADYYARFAAAAAGNGPQPVPAAEAVETLAVLDAAWLSAEEGLNVAI